MSNKNDKDLVNAIGDNQAFDDDVDLFDTENEKSDLGKQKKLAPRGQKVMMMFFIGLSILLVGWMAYGVMTKPKDGDNVKSKEARDSEQSNVFANASPKDFNQGFAEETPIDVPAASEASASEPIALADSGAVPPPVYNQAPVQPVNFNNQPVQPVNAQPALSPQELALQRKLNSGF
ncbi:hypothetical protein ACG9ZJ_21350, partial [Acinetobacter sp. ULE_I064]|uniref:hypothetical protein n=1 Tax=Acinetobacter sp. ULE_I064 TaxID=3373071 RepID=UPI003AF571CD